MVGITTKKYAPTTIKMNRDNVATILEAIGSVKEQKDIAFAVWKSSEYRWCVEEFIDIKWSIQDEAQLRDALDQSLLRHRVLKLLVRNPCELPESIKLLVNLTDINVSLRDIDLGCLSRLCGLAHLNKLVMACDVMTNVSALSRLTQLKSLTLHKYMSASPCSDSGSEIGSVVGTMTNLEELSLYFMSDTNVDWISNLVNLTSLDLTGVIGIEYVRHLTKLVRLCVYVHNSYVFDLEPLRNLIDLKRLRVRAAHATVQAVPLLNLTKLVALMLMAHRITDVGVVWSLVNLEQLKLHGDIQTIPGIEALTKLKSLDLGSTNLGDVDALRNLTTLTALNVSDNHITDATCLTSLVNLQTLDVSNNSEYCRVRGLDALPKIKRIRR